MTRVARWVGLGSVALGLIAAAGSCSSEETSTPTGQGAAGSGGTGAAGGAGATGGAGGGLPSECDPVAVDCESEMISAMNYKDVPAPGLISNEPDGGGWLSMIDATAGGDPFSPDLHAYVYGRFTADGLEKVNISDEESLGSMDWDVAFRRFIIRINSLDSGPSCVTRALLPSGTDYEALDAVPAGVNFHEDEYFTPGCDLIQDGSGLGTPATALSGFWTYTVDHCLQMTENVYVLHLATGEHVKLTVTHYYNPDAQEQCQLTGSVPADPDPGAANIRIRWAMLP